MTDTTTNEPAEAAEPAGDFVLETRLNFYPEYGDEEDANGMVQAKASMQTVAFGIGDPKVLLEMGVPEKDESDARLVLTIGDLDLHQLQDVLNLALATVEQAIEQDLRARIDAQQAAEEQ